MKISKQYNMKTNNNYHEIKSFKHTYEKNLNDISCININQKRSNHRALENSTTNSTTVIWNKIYHKNYIILQVKIYNN